MFQTTICLHCGKRVPIAEGVCQLCGMIFHDSTLIRQFAVGTEEDRPVIVKRYRVALQEVEKAA